MPVVPASIIMAVVNEKKYHSNSNQKDHQPHYFIEKFENLVHMPLIFIGLQYSFLHGKENQLEFLLISFYKLKL